VAFLFGMCMLAKPYHFGVNCPIPLCENNGAHFLPSIFNAVIGMTSYYRVILKMVVLHHAKTTIRNGVFVFFITP